MARAPKAGRSSTEVRSAMEASLGPFSAGTGTLGISVDAFCCFESARSSWMEQPAAPRSVAYAANVAAARSERPGPMTPAVAWCAGAGQVLRRRAPYKMPLTTRSRPP